VLLLDVTNWDVLNLLFIKGDRGADYGDPNPSTVYWFAPLCVSQRQKYTRAKGKTAPKQYNVAPHITRRGAQNAPII